MQLFWDFSSLSDIGTKLWELLTKTERASAAVLLILTFIGMLLETLGVGLIIPALALLTQENIESKHPSVAFLGDLVGHASPHTLLLGGLLFLVGVYLFKAAYLAMLAWKQAQFAFGVQVRISQQLFSVYLLQPYTFHMQRNSAELIANVTNEVNQLTGNTMLPAMIFLTESLVLTGLLILLLIIEPIGAITTIGLLGFAAWAFQRMTKERVLRWGEARQLHERMRIQHLQQGLGGVKDVKIFAREPEFLAKYFLHNQRGASAAKFQTTLQQLPRLWLEVLAVCGLALLTFSMLHQGKNLAAVLPVLGLFAASAFRIIPSVNRILSSLQLLRYGLPVVDTLYRELQLAPRPDRSVGGPIIICKSSIRAKDVSFVYPNTETPAIDRINLIIKKGEAVGFIGKSGSGKSTLIDVLLGLLPPSSGQIFIDKRDIAENLQGWHRQIGYVSQSIFLTDDTLRRNVAFGLDDCQINDNDVWRAIRAARLEDFVLNLKDGLNTSVGERGIRLSGGQRQRIGIARALYHDPSVLVLDEATSALDSVTENEVMEAVEALRGKKTVIVVAHRLSTIAHCDRVFHLDRGRLIAEGPPSEICANPYGTNGS
jgi:ABC-type multidrug transport system fused ATPase/permease subunit